MRLVGLAEQFLSGDLNPKFFAYPTLYIYLLAAFFLVADFIRDGLDVAEHLHLARIITAFFGAVAVYFTFLIAKEFTARRIALLAAFLMSCCYLHVRDSHFSTTDIPAATLILLSVLLFLRLSSSCSPRSIALVGLVSGLAISVKYGSLFLCGTAVLTLWLSCERGRFVSFYVLFLLCCLVGFIIGSPYTVIEFTMFLKYFLTEAVHLRIGHNKIDLGYGWWYHPRYTLLYGVGVLVLLTGILGLAFEFTRNRSKALILASFPALFFIAAGAGKTVFLRYMVPATPFLCIGSALFVNSVFPKLASRTIPIVLIALLFVSEPLYRIINTNSLLSTQDTRELAAQFISSSASKGDSFYSTGLLANNTEIVSAKDLGISPVSKLTQDALPNYVILHRGPIKYYNQQEAQLEALLSTLYSRVKTFSAVSSGASSLWYDQLDAFYIPFYGFQGVLRPGPDIAIYQLKQ